MTVKLVRRWPYLVFESAYEAARKRALERFERVEQRIINGAPSKLSRIENNANEIVRLADDLLHKDRESHGG
ncbi:MAG: hypothetical protein GWN84_13185 [Gammaproteobacteria bacterium]|nr:hypothetical protein [Gammaproteobacteria bacterium]NIR83783.1 hypothetical protein [Gammaproteobacteria bacterium]NIU05109.1 hypothetical protein [Gammaproteobacteria bacterium]NIV51946.1 hypothetical protein [Gammaproteobacteria bacterium]NIX86382.1 hypothetical protein [Gammaproteobacteria bacterium]